MSVPSLVLAVSLLSSAPAAAENQNHCWQDSGRSGPRGWGRYEYHLVNRCEREIQVWDAIVVVQDDGTEERWSCEHGPTTSDEFARSGCRPLNVKPGGTATYATRSGERYRWFACYPDDARCNELGKKWADNVHGLPRSWDPAEVARRVLRGE